MLLIKAITYRAFASVITFLCALILTGKYDLSAGICVAEFLSKIVGYYAFDKIWEFFGSKRLGKCIWISGAAASGKTTYAKSIATNDTIILDGDDARNCFSRGLTHSRADVAENVRRIALTAKAFVKDGRDVVVSCVSPFAKDRKVARKIIGRTYQEIIMVCDKKELEERWANSHRKDFKDMAHDVERPLGYKAQIINTSTKK